MTIDAPAKSVFNFIADIRNLPKYLPTTEEAKKQGPERVHVQGEAHGHEYDADGYLRANQDEMRLEWGADEGYYSGYMQLKPQNGNGQTDVTVHLTFKEKPSQGGDAPSDADIEEGMRKALESIQNHMTGNGGKEEPAAKTR
ncbi:MAG: SRPBCC family protein [Armatimonadaceae bacterium]